MTDEIRTTLTKIITPYRREVRIDDVAFDSGMHLLRMVIREGHRITQFDMDAPTARAIADALNGWAEENAAQTDTDAS